MIEKILVSHSILSGFIHPNSFFVRILRTRARLVPTVAHSLLEFITGIGIALAAVREQIAGSKLFAGLSSRSLCRSVFIVATTDGNYDHGGHLRHRWDSSRLG